VIARHNECVYTWLDRSSLPVRLLEAALLAKSALLEAAAEATLLETATEATTEAALTLTLLGRHTIAVTGHVAGSGLALVLVKLGVVGDGLALAQRLKTVGVDSGEMDEDILTTIGRGDEAEALLAIEKLNGTLLRHFE